MSFHDYVTELEQDPEMKAALDEALARYRDEDDPPAGVREPRRPTPSTGGQSTEGDGTSPGEET